MTGFTVQDPLITEAQFQERTPAEVIRFPRRAAEIVIHLPAAAPPTLHLHTVHRVMAAPGHPDPREGTAVAAVFPAEEAVANPAEAEVQPAIPAEDNLIQIIHL